MRENLEINPVNVIKRASALGLIIKNQIEVSRPVSINLR